MITFICIIIFRVMSLCLVQTEERLTTYYLSCSNVWYDRLTIGSNGNVGIGTTEPAEKLSVAGNIKVDGTIMWYRVCNMS
jgi:hypothetical protein